MREKVAFFKENGYCVLPEALHADEVEKVNLALDVDRVNHPELWQNRGNGRFQNANILLGCPTLDITIFHPNILPLVTLLLGDEACFGEYSVMLREPITTEPPVSKWHRDTSHLPEHPMALSFLSVIYYLTDVDESTHCFGIVPEGVDQKRQMPNDLNGEKAVPLHGKAGTAILFNAGSCHDVIYRSGNRERRTIHIYFGHHTQEPLSNHTIFPGRLLNAQEDQHRCLFSHPNQITQLVQNSFQGVSS